MDSWAIRNATLNDAENISAFAHGTFRENFTHYDPEALAKFLPTHYSVETFRAQLNDSAYRIWLVESQGAIIGNATIGPCKLPLAPSSLPVIELQRLYVASPWQKQKIGAALMELALTEVHARHAKSIYLGVWEHNTNAQAFYTRHGFSKVGEYDYPPIGNVHDREWIMARNVML